MMSITHGLFSLLILTFLGGLFGMEFGNEEMALAVLFSLLPDIDCPKSAIGTLLFPFSRLISAFFGHRTITHSLLGFIPVVFLGLTLAPFIGVEKALAMIIGYGSHLLADGMTISGCPLLYPDPRPFWFLPRSLLVKTGSWQELVFFFITLFFTIATTGVSKIGLRSLLHILVPSFHGAYQDFCKYCDGYGTKSLCRIRADVCDESVCGVVEGIGIGLMLGNLILYENGSYLVIRDRTTNAVRVERLKDVSIERKKLTFTRKPFSYVRSKLSKVPGRYSTISGVLEFEDFVCDNCNEFVIPDEVFKVSYQRVIIHHLLVRDFLKLEARGFIKSGHLTVKIVEENERKG